MMTNVSCITALAAAVFVAAGIRLAEEKAAYRVLGNDKGKVAIVNARGEVEWEYPARFDGHDLWLLANGNVLLATGPARIAEVTPEKGVAWQYESKPKEG